MSATHTNDTEALRARVSELELQLAEALSNQASFETELAARNGELAKAEEKAVVANKHVKQLEEMIDKVEKERAFLIDWIGEQYSEGDKHLVEMALRGEDMGADIASVKKLRDGQGEKLRPAITFDFLLQSFANHTHEYEQPDGVGETKKPMVPGMLGGTLALPFIDAVKDVKPLAFLYYEDENGLFVFGNENHMKMQIGQEKGGFVIYPGKNCILQVDGLIQPRNVNHPIMLVLNQRAVFEKVKAMDEIVNLLFVRNRSYEEHNSDRYDEIVGIAAQFKPKAADKKEVGVEKAK